MTTYTLNYGSGCPKGAYFWENDKGEQYGPYFPTATLAVQSAGNKFLREKYGINDLHSETCVIPLIYLQELLLTEMDLIQEWLKV